MKTTQHAPLPFPRRALGAIALCLVPTLATAADSPAIEEIIVTAQKRDENLQDVPIALLALNAERLEQLGIDNIGDIGAKLPNVRTTAFPYSPSTIRMFVRGIGSNETMVTQDPSVGVYLNGIYVARSVGLAMDVVDLERMEVLYGPQGTLYGRNTTGGAINLVTARPSGAFGLKQDVSIGERDHRRLRTQLDLPAVGDVSARVAYLRSSTDGWIDNDGPGEDFGNDEREGLLLALNWKIADNVSADYTFDRSELDFSANYYQATEGTGPATGNGYGSLAPILPFLGGPAGVVVPEESDPVHSAALKNPFDDGDSELFGHALTLSWEITPDLTLRSLTGYREIKEKTYQDFSANPDFTFFRNDPVDMEQDQFSQEFQAIGNAYGGRLRYVAGAYWFEESGTEFEIDRADVFFISPPLFGDSLVITQRETEAENNAWAVYGQGTWAFNDKLELTLGARWSEDEREAKKTDIFFPSVAHGDNSYSRFNPAVVLAYSISEQANVYAKVVSGYKSGGFNLRAPTVDSFEGGFDEENLVSYEIGLKSEWWENRLRLNGAFFFSDYEDIQVDIPLQFNPSLTNTFNAGKAEIYGAELDLTAVLAEGLTLSFGYGWLDAEFEEVIDPQTGNDLTSIYVLPDAPDNSYRVELAYQRQLGFGELQASANYAWQDDVYTQGDAVLARGAYIDSYGLINARLGIAGIKVGQTALDVSVWGRNLADEEWVMDSIGSFRGFIADRLAAYGEPRTVGVDFTFRL